ncbi:MAG: type II toxin-antitoxin system VapC family toxin [Dehalococcoidia bacterium]
MTYLVDTMVWSEMRRSRPHRVVAAWFDSQDADVLFMSVMTVGEIRAGASVEEDPDRKGALDAWLADMRAQLAGNLLPVNAAAAEVWGEIHARRSAVGAMPAFVDSLIAATAYVHGLTVVTRNVGHFENLGVPVLNPWELKDN